MKDQVPTNRNCTEILCLQTLSINEMSRFIHYTKCYSLQASNFLGITIFCFWSCTILPQFYINIKLVGPYYRLNPMTPYLIYVTLECHGKSWENVYSDQGDVQVSGENCPEFQGTTGPLLWQAPAGMPNVHIRYQILWSLHTRIKSHTLGLSLCHALSLKHVKHQFIFQKH